jgi:hypothetical protein
MLVMDQCIQCIDQDKGLKGTPFLRHTLLLLSLLLQCDLETIDQEKAGFVLGAEHLSPAQLQDL